MSHFLGWKQNMNYLIFSPSFAGPPDPSKTIFVRHSSTVVCTADIPHILSIEPRDEFNNICMFQPGDDPTLGYSVSISEVSGPDPLKITDHICHAQRFNIKLPVFYVIFIDWYCREHVKISET
jgi:hypothetical protein